jgi:hypothetical protein
VGVLNNSLVGRDKNAENQKAQPLRMTILREFDEKQSLSQRSWGVAPGSHFPDSAKHSRWGQRGVCRKWAHRRHSLAGIIVLRMGDALIEVKA